MPAKATLYNSKAEPLFDFGIGPRNEVHYNSVGNMLVLCGFGNLAGNMEFWSTQERKLVSKMQISNTTQFEWAPDGQHFFTATTTPRLRQDNGYRILHYTGRQIYENQFKAGVELWELRWRPRKATQKPFQIHFLTDAEMAVASQTVLGVRKDNGGGSAHTNLPAGAINKGGAYVPPHMRKGGGPVGAQLCDENYGKKSAVNKPSAEKVKPEAPKLDEKEKKIRNIEKKLDDIRKLREKIAAGVELELNQLVKIKKEDELLVELQKLKM